jgi:hypothetical protein
MKSVIQDVSEEDLDREFTTFAENPDTLEHELDQMSTTMSDEALNEGIERHGSVDAFFDALALFVAFKAALVRKGLKSGSAAGAAGGVLFGLGALGEGIARASGLAIIGDIIKGLEAARGMSQDAAELSAFTADMQPLPHADLGRGPQTMLI